MSIVEVKAPTPGESITEVTVGEWVATPGQWVEEDDTLVVIESDKVNMEVPSPSSGVLSEALVSAGDVIQVGDLLAKIDPNGKPAEQVTPQQEDAGTSATASSVATSNADEGTRVMPSAQRLLAQKGLSANDVQATGPGGRLLKGDVLRHESGATQQKPSTQVTKSTQIKRPEVSGSRSTETVKMSPIRKTVARRLVEAQQTAAILSTFNEVDMSAIMSLRKRYQDRFVEKHGVKLGFMSFFVRAVVEALKVFPAVNARIEGDQIIYHHYYDIGIAVGGGKGLVVPVLRNTEALGLAEVELAIRDFGARAQKNMIKLDEMQGGTFSITNGGVYGSLLSTPILNPPQSGILGMHGIQDRPIAVNGEVVIRPMMYIALSYDHRIVDGREAVSFLKRVKELLEDPQRILLEI